jgi:hypothetical protein
MTDLPVPDDILESWLGEPVPEEKRKEIIESTMKYLISYYRTRMIWNYGTKGMIVWTLRLLLLV